MRGGGGGNTSCGRGMRNYHSTDSGLNTAKITSMYHGLLYRLHGALAHAVPELPRKMPCCFSCAVLISVLRNLATLRGAEFHVWASLAT